MKLRWGEEGAYQGCTRPVIVGSDGLVEVWRSSSGSTAKATLSSVFQGEEDFVEEVIWEIRSSNSASEKYLRQWEKF